MHDDTSPSQKWPGGEATVTPQGQTNPTERRAEGWEFLLNLQQQLARTHPVLEQALINQRQLSF